MSYNIEGIDWKTKPEGATHFCLEDDDWWFTWLKKVGGEWHFYRESISEWCKNGYDDTRIGYRIKDHNPNKITNLENLVKEQAKQIEKLINENSNLSQTLVYLTDEEFRKFAFKLNYGKLITDYLENESRGDKWV